MPEQKTVLYSKAALVIIMILNSFAVDLMLYSGSGISAISSVPYALNQILPFFSLGTWTYFFQLSLVLILMILRKRFVLSYLFSFVIGLGFSVMLDVHQIWISQLPKGLIYDLIYFMISYLAMSIGIALSNQCLMPIIPTDLFPRELVMIIHKPYANIKISFDLICLAITLLSTSLCLGNIQGLGLGTIITALTMGKAIAICQRQLSSHLQFQRYIHHRSVRTHSA